MLAGIRVDGVRSRNCEHLAQFGFGAGAVGFRNRLSGSRATKGRSAAPVHQT
jgi:hypothetical protein